jgi:hypothetical protein
MNLPSTFLSLNIRDFFKGAALAVIIPGLVTIQQALMNPPINWKAIGITALATFIGYLIKNLFTDTNAAAVKTIQAAEQKQIDKQSN